VTHIARDAQRRPLWLRTEQFSAKRLEKKPYGTLELAYVVAGVAKSGLSETIEFSVRQSVEDHQA